MKLREQRPDRNRSPQSSHQAVVQRRGVPGKRTLTMGLPSGRSASPAQRKPEAGGASPGRAQTGPVEDWMRVAMRPDLYDTPVQCASADEIGYAGAEPASAPRATAGTTMPAVVQAKMERAFGADFSAVRVHEGPEAPALGALAYAQGTDIHFAPGQYDPGSQRGQEILGHELAHVVQQAQGRVQATGQAKGVGLNEEDALEREADDMGARAARGEVVSAAGAARAGAGQGAAGPIQRMTFQRLQQSMLGSLFWNPPQPNKEELQLLKIEQQTRQRLDSLQARVGDTGEHAETWAALDQQLSQIEGATITEDAYKSTLQALSSLGSAIQSLGAKLDQIEKQQEREQEKVAMAQRLGGYSDRMTEAEGLVTQYQEYELDPEEEPFQRVQELTTRSSRVREVYDKIPQDSSDGEWLERAKGFETSFKTNGGGLTTVLGSAREAVKPYETARDKERTFTAGLEAKLGDLVRSATRKSATIEQARSRLEDKHDEVRGNKDGYKDGKDFAEALRDWIRPLSLLEDQALTALDEIVQIQAQALTDKDRMATTNKISEIQQYQQKLQQALKSCQAPEALIAKACLELQTFESEYQQLCTKHGKLKPKGSGAREDSARNDNNESSGARSLGDTVQHDGRSWHRFAPGLYGCIRLPGNSVLAGPALALFQDALQYKGLIGSTSLGESGVKLKSGTYEIKVRRTNLTAHRLDSDLRIYSTQHQEQEIDGQTVRLITFGEVGNGH